MQNPLRRVLFWRRRHRRFNHRVIDGRFGGGASLPTAYLNTAKRGPFRGPRFCLRFASRHGADELASSGAGCILDVQTGLRHGAVGLHFGKFSLITIDMACLLEAALPAFARCPERPPCKGCGCKGGPGYRIDATGKCVGFKALKSKCGDPPTLKCTFENSPGTGLSRACALGEPAETPD